MPRLIDRATAELVRLASGPTIGQDRVLIRGGNV